MSTYHIKFPPLVSRPGVKLSIESSKSLFKAHVYSMVGNTDYSVCGCCRDGREVCGEVQGPGC